MPDETKLLKRRQAIQRSLKKRRARLKLEGICVDCAKGPAEPGRTTCEDCLGMRRLRGKLAGMGLTNA